MPLVNFILINELKFMLQSSLSNILNIIQKNEFMDKTDHFSMIRFSLIMLKLWRFFL
jgi:hypothetical protein